MRIAIDLLVLLILMLANGFLAMAEMSIVSSRPSRLQAMAAAGKPGAATALKLLQNPGDFLSTVQIGITLIGIFAGAFGGATLAAPLAESLRRVEFLVPYATQIAIFVVVLATTYLALVVAELTPKRLALSKPEAIACLVAPALDLLSRLARPLVSLLDRSSGALAHLLGVRSDDAPAVTDDEVRVLLRQGAQLGVFEPIEEEIVAQLFRLSDRRASAIMTPRTEIVWIDVNQSLEEIRDLIVSSPHSRFPLAEDSLDHVIGIVYARDLLVQRLVAETIDLRSLAKPALFVPENMSALDVVEQMRKKRIPVALIINEYGGVEGLVTITDVVEAILGAIEEARMDEEPDVVQREDGSWLVNGLWSVDAFQEYFHLNDLPLREELDYQTVGGMVMALLGEIPTIGSQVQIDGYRVEVVDMDGRRVDKVLVQRMGGEG
ncbi:MAG: hemolysin family protein [Caldilinea sp.]|nr:hemolysin family protein [Caldilinea sp.]MDW8439313.1 hemolysin family protein [Caldilineaceae bacterium]